MNIKYKLILILLLFGLFCTINPGFVIGQIEKQSEAINSEIRRLNSDIDDQKNNLKKVQELQEKYSKAIEQKRTEKASLNNQLAILDNRLAKAELDIELVEININRTKLEIQKTDLEIKEKNREITDEKGHIANVIRLMQKKDNVSSMEIMLLNNSLGDFLSQIKYLEDINEEVDKGLENIKDLAKQLEKEKVALNVQNEELIALKRELDDSRAKLEAEKEDKIFIVEQVSTSEKEYQRLLAQAKKEQEDAAAEIASMEKLVRAKLAKLDGKELEFNDNGLIWPVPKNTITSYFHDPDYPFRNIFEHPAVDIRAAQGTTLKASASGYVARTQTGGSNGYGYIMLIHGDGLSTVYGHASKIYVQEDEYVVQGQNIGLSGGLPGTPGAGRLTTGPHLHFETRLNGIPVDPLSYLP